MKENGAHHLPLFETKAAKVRAAYAFFASTVLLGIFFIWVYRLIYIPKTGEPGRWVWIGMFISELLFTFYWLCTQSVRLNVVSQFPFKERLSLRYEDKLPGVDVFVCTADPKIEPPVLVINTVLSAMAYNYPSEKLSIYLSDDGGSDLMFYALFEASEFAKYWLPFCKKFKVEPRAPAAYFSRNVDSHDSVLAQEWYRVEKLFVDMKSRIEKVAEQESVPKEIKEKHKGFREWNSGVAKNNHQSIVQILIDGRNPNSIDIDGCRLPTLVYLSREKRPQKSHNFKAGSMNALIRVSAEISNGPIILNLDCDMYSNDSDSIREALCFFMDEEKGYKTSYVQYPQRYYNINKNDTYSNIQRVVHEIELAGLGGCGAALYCGTGCFHRRASLCGQKFSEVNRNRNELYTINEKSSNRTVEELEEASNFLANCSFEDGTQWGKEMGLVYGFPVEDIVTGLSIQCRGWKSIYYNPRRYGFVGMAPISLEQCLVQFKRWCEGLFQIFISKYCPFIYGHGRINLSAQMGYCIYLLWAPLSFPTLYYVIAPALCLLHDVPLFPKVSSLWFIPFGYVFIARNAYSLIEALRCKETIKSWCNSQRMLLYKRTTSYFFALIDSILLQLGFSQTNFVITAKVDDDDDILNRYKNGIMEFGSNSIMFTIISTIALLNLLSLVVWGIFKKIIFLSSSSSASSLLCLQQQLPQIILCGLMVMINLPVYEALFFRTDKGRIPTSVFNKSIIIAAAAAAIASFICF